MVNLLCNFRKFTYDKRTKSVMVSQVKPEGPTKLGAEGAIPPPPPPPRNILTGIELLNNKYHELSPTGGFSFLSFDQAVLHLLPAPSS